MANAMIKQIMQTAMFQSDLFEDIILYNGVEMKALVELGDSDAQQKIAFGRSGMTVIAGNGQFTVSLNDVPKPKRQDRIEYNGNTYYVAGVDFVDSLGGNVTVRVVENERGYVHL